MYGRYRILLLLAVSLSGFYEQTTAQYVCYRDVSCSVDDPRPVFTLGDSLEECCEMPNIVAAMEHDSSNCSMCGSFSAERVTPATVELVPPGTLVLEIEASSYSAITWIRNGDAMHDFPRLELEDFSKRLLLFNTSEVDYGTYEADVYPISGGSVVTITFLVTPAISITPSATIPTRLSTTEVATSLQLPSILPSLTPTPTAPPFVASAWPEVLEVNVFQPEKIVVFFCEGTSTQTLYWMSSISDVILNQYCGDSLLAPIGEAPTDVTTLPPTTLPTTPDPRPLRQAGPLPPELCSVVTMVVDRDTSTVHSVLTVNALMLQQSVSFTCTAEGTDMNGETITDRNSVELVIVDNPFFNMRPRPIINTIISLFVELECVATANPAPAITWFGRNAAGETIITSNVGNIFVNTQVLPNPSVQGFSTSSVLSISNVQLENSAVYVCEAESSNAKTETNSTLNVRAPASISLPPEDFTTTVFGISVLSCRSIGVPIPDIFWARLADNGSLQYIDDLASGNIFISTAVNQNLNRNTRILTILNTTFEFSGTYVCITTNGVTLGNLTNIVQNASATLNVLPVACSPEEFGCSNGVQCVSSLFVCDNFVDCRDGSDELGCTEIPANIVKAPDDVLVSVYGIASFICQSNGIPQSMISWAYQGDSGLVVIDGLTELPTGTAINMETDFNPLTNITTGNLILMGVQFEDSGEYVCLTDNGIGTPSSRIVKTASAFLNISTIPHVVEVIVVGETTTLTEGDDLRLICNAEGSPTPQITWLRNGKPITLEGSQTLSSEQGVGEDTRYIITYTSVREGFASSQLLVRNALPGLSLDEGEYTCRVDNIIDTGTGVSAVDSVQLTIQARDDCLLNVELPQLTPCQNNATCEDMVGGYMCTCVGPYEGTNCSEPVTVVETPVIVTPPEDQSEVEIFAQVTFTCGATGEPQPTYSWQKDGELLMNTSEGRLTLLEVQPQDRGAYTCIAHNIQGNSPVSTAGLLSLRGVYQYVVDFTGCATDSFEELLRLMTNALAGRDLPGSGSTIYSIAPRPLPDAANPPTDQVVITVVVGDQYELIDGSTRDIQDALLIELQVLTESHQCTFTDIQRYDGCVQTSYTFNEEYSNIISWSETDLNKNATIVCPCGTLDPDVHDSRTLVRSCAGTFTYRAEWEEVVDGCGYTEFTYELCDITNLDMSEQFSELAEATEEVSSFDSLDIAVASAIVKNLAQSDDVVADEVQQQRFVQTFSNLLQTNREVVTESQVTFGSTSSLLESLEVFTQRIQLDSANPSKKLTEELIQIQVEEMPLSEFSGTSFMPDLTDMAASFQTNVTETPLMDANITLPESLADFIQQSRNSTTASEALRVVNFVLLEDTLFVLNKDNDGLDGRMVGNLFIAASVSFPEKVQNLVDPVTIEFIQTEGLDMTSQTSNATCVFWELPTDGAFGRWSSEGCRLVSIEGGSIKCECDHLTHFGIIFAIDPLPAPNLPLEIITYIGTGLSLVCISIILLTYLCSRKLRKQAISKMVINMCIPLGLFYVWFLLAIHGRYYNTVVWFCYICSTLVQYFLLVYLCWTLMQAIHIYLKLVRIFGSDIHHYVLKSAIFAWGLPLVITAISAGFGITYDMWAINDSEGSLYICYPSSYPLYFGVIAPFVLILFINVILFMIIMASLSHRLYEARKMKDVHTEKNNLKELRKLVLIGVCLSVMFGLGWAFGLLAQIPVEVIIQASQYLFSLFIGFQGVMIFILHGLRSSDAKKEWKRWMYKVLCCVKTPPDLLTTTTGYSRPMSPTRKSPTTNFTSITVDDPHGDRHSKNPLYQSQDQLDQPDKNTSYSPVNDTPSGKEGKEDTTTITLIPPSPKKKHSDRDSDEAESQTVEVNFATLEEPSDEEEYDLIDLKKVPFSEGELGTAMGPQVIVTGEENEDQDEGDTSQLMQATEL